MLSNVLAISLHASGMPVLAVQSTQLFLSFSNCASLVKLCFSFLMQIDEYNKQISKQTCSTAYIDPNYYYYYYYYYNSC